MSIAADRALAGMAADPRAVLRIARRHWRLVALLAIGLPVLAGLGVARQKSVYTATGTLLYAPVDFSPKLLRGLVDAGRVTDTLMASQIAVIRSNRVIETLIDRLGLARRAEFEPSLRKPSRWRGWLGLSQPQLPPLSRTALIDEVRHALLVTVPPDAQLIEVGFRSADPKLAAAAANLAMATYLDGQRGESLALLDHAQTWLAGRAAATAQSLAATDVAIARARAISGTERGTAGLLTNQAAGRLTDDLVQAQSDLATANAALAQAGGGMAASAAAAVAPDIAPMRAREAELAARLSALSAAEGPNYPEVRAARRSLAALRGQISAETGRLVKADRARVAADRSRVAALGTALAGARVQAASAAMRAAPLAGLEERQAAEQSLLRAQTEQIGTLESQSALTRPDARILSPATRPENPDTPHGLAIVGGATLLGLCLGLLAALAADAMNGCFRSGGEVRAVLDRACIALVPEVGRRQRKGMSVADYASAHPFSPFTEQMRALRAELYFEATPPRILAVTAARPGEGKTTLALALAASLAASGARVLAVDCDVRQPGFDAAFDLAGAPGLTDWLAGRATLDAALHPGAAGAPDVMPAGAVAIDALSLFMGPRMDMLIDQLRARYDLVILDLPPVFALAEARVLARHADATLFCVRWAATPRRVVSASLALLEQAGIRLAGVVLTRVDSARHAKAGFDDSELYHPRYGGYFRP